MRRWRRRVRLRPCLSARNRGGDAPSSRSPRSRGRRAGILQRELTVGIGTQLAGRALFAVLGLLVYVAVAERGAVLRAFRAVGRAGLAVAALMAISSGSFIIALNHASVANILFMQALAPVLAAVFGMLVGEPVSRRTWLAMAVALGGVVLMVGGPGQAARARLRALDPDDDVVCRRRS